MFRTPGKSQVLEFLKRMELLKRMEEYNMNDQDTNTKEELEVAVDELVEDSGRAGITKPVRYIAGPFSSNRKHRRTFMSLNAARHKRVKGYTEGYRGYVNHRGQIII